MPAHGVPLRVLPGGRWDGCHGSCRTGYRVVARTGRAFKERFCQIAPHNVEEVWRHVQEMLDGGAIRPSQSPWCNAIVLVWKKNGTLWFCIDFRRLNTRKRKDWYLIPRGPETMESLVGTRYFSTMDLKSGFWQVKMSEESRQYTAFTVGSMGVYKFLRMPYGLCNAPAMFQHLMQNCLGELNLQFSTIYLDNVIVYSRMQEDHLTHLQAVLDRFAHHGLKLKPSKCHFFKENITYLGHKISAWYATRPRRHPEYRQYGTPHHVTGIRKFVGAVGYFRCVHQELLLYVPDHWTISPVVKTASWRTTLLPWPPPHWRCSKPWKRSAWQRQYWHLWIWRSLSFWKPMHLGLVLELYCYKSRGMENCTLLHTPAGLCTGVRRITTHPNWSFSP